MPNISMIQKTILTVEVNDGDLFSYIKCQRQKIVGIERVFDDRFKLMENYGKITDGKAAFGPEVNIKGAMSSIGSRRPLSLPKHKRFG